MGEYRDQLMIVRRDDQGIATFVIVINARFFAEDASWVAVCEELGTTAYSGTIDGAKAELAEALELQLNEVERLGFAEEFLKSHGVTPIHIQAPAKAANAAHSWELVGAR